MYNPEDPNEKKERSPGPIHILAKQPVPTIPKKVIEASELLTEKDTFRHYCMTSAEFRESRGVRVRAGVAEVINTVSLEQCEEWQKEILREVCLKLVREYKNASKFWEDKS